MAKLWKVTGKNHPFEDYYAGHTQMENTTQMSGNPATVLDHKDKGHFMLRHWFTFFTLDTFVKICTFTYEFEASQENEHL